jgi:hypothetical protein
MYELYVYVPVKVMHSHYAPSFWMNIGSHSHACNQVVRQGDVVFAFSSALEPGNTEMGEHQVCLTILYALSESSSRVIIHVLYIYTYVSYLC